MIKTTKKENEIIELLKKNPFLGQEEIAYKLRITRSSVAGHLARLIKKGILQRGYILNEAVNGVAVIGGANVDIKGIADTAFFHGSSNPGKVYKAPGGVARNVAENLARLQIPVTLYTLVGKDEEGEWLINTTGRSGVNVQYIEQLSEYRTGLYLSILNEKKEQLGSISDMQIMESFDEAWIEKILPHLLSFQMIFIDTNLPKTSLYFLLNYLKDKGIPVIVDPVSAKKAERLRGALTGIQLITPNREEAEALTGISITNKNDLLKAANQFFDQGVKQVVITLGSDGVFAADGKSHFFLPSPIVGVKDTTGAGDAFAAGIIYGLSKKSDLFDACKYGHTMAAITLTKEQTVAADLTADDLEKRKKEFFQNE